MVQVQFCELHKISPGEVQPGANNTKTNGYALSVNSGASSTLTFDANGNMTSDGTNSYSWDAENRVIQITFPGTGNNSQFSYDGWGKNVQILEYTSSSLTSTKQFIWSGNRRREARNSAGSVTTQYYRYGETINGTSYFYSLDKLGSVREMTDSTGILQAQYMYDAYGRVIKTQGLLASDFQYAEYYFHATSGLDLTRTRAYNSSYGRFINRDPIAEIGGINLYGYARRNNPVGSIDPSGLEGGPDPNPSPEPTPPAPQPAPPPAPQPAPQPQPNPSPGPAPCPPEPEPGPPTRPGEEPFSPPDPIPDEIKHAPWNKEMACKIWCLRENPHPIPCQWLYKCFGWCQDTFGH